jgi:hypothetical protein
MSILEDDIFIDLEEEEERPSLYLEIPDSDYYEIKKEDKPEPRRVIIIDL